MAEPLLCARDLRFLVFEWLDAPALCTRPRFGEHGRETFEAVLDLAERVARDVFQPINRALDEDEPRFEGDAVRTSPVLAPALREAWATGLFTAAQDEAAGGMQLPCLVEKAAFAWLSAASIAAQAYPFLTIANANLLRAQATPELAAYWLPLLLSGQAFGTMCLSEPQAGSSLGDIRCRAEPMPNGRYRLFGNKVWISGGDHDLAANIVHLVLAKIPLADGQLLPGTAGISLFLVPRTLPPRNIGNGAATTPAEGDRNDVVTAGLNHKLGYRGTTNCLLNFGEGGFRPEGDAGAIGWLVGEPGRGLAGMFLMMNEARIGVGLGAVALGYAGYRSALEYARQRPQGRRIDERNPASPQVPIIEHADVRRMLLAQKAWVEGGLALALWCARLIDERDTARDAAEHERASDLLDLLTPIAKSWPSQWCLAANDLAIQVLGGYGYTRDFPVEQYWRDNRLNAIHEGTHGIQALDLLARKVARDDGRLVRRFAGEVGRTLAAASALGGESRRLALTLQAYSERIANTLGILMAAPDRQVVLAESSTFLEAFGHYVVGWIWLEQWIVARRALSAGGLSTDDASFYEGKCQATRYYFRRELPRIGPLLLVLDSADDTALAMRDAWF